VGYRDNTQNGSKTAAQPSTDNVAMDITATRAETGRSVLLAASNGAAE
jgi:hypothetical protein